MEPIERFEKVQRALRGRRTLDGWKRSRRIRELRLQGLSHKEIAKICGCSVRLVSAVLCNSQYPIDLDPREIGDHE